MVGLVSYNSLSLSPRVRSPILPSFVVCGALGNLGCCRTITLGYAHAPRVRSPILPSFVVCGALGNLGCCRTITLGYAHAPRVRSPFLPSFVVRQILITR
jgi:hypothetical protein